jgi:hypothetical protein
MTGQSKLFNILLDKNEETALRIIARQDSRNLSETIRELIRQEASRRGFPPIGSLVKNPEMGNDY